MVRKGQEDWEQGEESPVGSIFFEIIVWFEIVAIIGELNVPTTIPTAEIFE